VHSFGGVPIAFLITSWLDNIMAYLDSDDLSAIKSIFEDVLQKKLGLLAYKLDNFIKREEFYKRINQILEIARSSRKDINST
jgi:hypothetical protein